MTPTTQPQVALLSENTVRFDAGLSLGELYGQLDGRELLVEPLSARQPIRQFVAEGGLGFGAASEGSFAASICRVRTTQFEYGSDHQALYNVGYPLHRLIEGAAQSEIGNPKSEIRNPMNVPAGEQVENLTVYVRPRQDRVAVFRPADAASIEPPAEATDVFYVNAAAAKLLGLDRAGLVAIFPEDLAPDEPRAQGVWERRFIEDALPRNHAVLKALVQPSQLAKCAQLLEPSGGVFFALFVRLGLLLLATGEAEALKQAESEIIAGRLAWKLPGTRA